MHLQISPPLLHPSFPPPPSVVLLPTLSSVYECEVGRVVIELGVLYIIGKLIGKQNTLLLSHALRQGLYH